MQGRDGQVFVLINTSLLSPARQPCVSNFPPFNMSLNCISLTPFPLLSRASLSKSVVSGTDTIHLYCHISKIHLYYFFTFRIFFILTQPNLRFKIFSIKVWGSIPLFISRGRISPLASFHLVEIVDPTLPYDMLF